MAGINLVVAKIETVGAEQQAGLDGGADLFEFTGLGSDAGGTEDDAFLPGRAAIGQGTVPDTGLAALDPASRVDASSIWQGEEIFISDVEIAS